MSRRSNPTVAVVDDDYRVRESVQSLLESAGYTTLPFALAEALLESGTLPTVACLITDVRMPGMDGMELYRRVKEERPQLPVIFVSAHPSEETRQRALKQGAAAFLYKPFDAAELLGTIEAVLNNDSLLES